MRHDIPMLDLNLEPGGAHIHDSDTCDVPETIRQREDKANDYQGSKGNPPQGQISLRCVRPPQHRKPALPVERPRP